MIYVTGDIHGSIDIRKLTKKGLKKRKEAHLFAPDFKENDYLIICGDFGLLWSTKGSKFYAEEQFWLNWLEKQKYTVLFVDGNHENFDIIDNLNVKEWNGGKVHYVRKNIIHLMRGQVYDIDGFTFFTMGGASSHDIEYRTEGVTWWSRELPDEHEYAEAVKNLEAHGNTVDYIITHCAPLSIQREIEMPYAEDELVRFLETEVMRKVRYKMWFNGHYHMDADLDRNIILYDEIVPIDFKERLRKRKEKENM